jgi:phage tail-like protein
MTRAAAFLPRPVEPPHDARFKALGAPNRWNVILADKVDAGRPDGVLTLASKAGAAGLGAADGSLGGLVPPRSFTPAPDHRHVLLDAAAKRILVFEPCRCAFAMVPCLPSSRLALAAPMAVLAAGERLYVSDAGEDAAVLVYARPGLVLRALWRPPAGALPKAWSPGLLARSGRTLWVADAANGALHRFASTGVYLGAITGIGALAALACDADGAIWIVRQGEDVAHRLDESGAIVESVARRDALAARFAPPLVRVLADGSLLIEACDPAPARFAPDGTRLPPPPAELLAPAFEREGTCICAPMDSGIEACAWHRIVPAITVPAGGRAELSCLTSDAPLTDAALLALPDAAWQTQASGASSGDCLILAPPGRYLWLRLRLFGPGSATPEIRRVEIEFPRVSLARLLPAAFRADPIAADLTDRFVAVMDRPLRDIEHRIDHHAALYDPAAAPARPGADMLGFIAGWIGLRFESRWPVEKRRRLLAAMGRLLALRGTAEGLRQALIAYFGWREPAKDSPTPVPAGCHPRCGLPAGGGAPGLPVLVLEHWKLRRWLFLGAGRLGDASLLWGAAILNKTELDKSARAGVSRLDSVHDSLRDPFHAAAWRFSVFLPARLGREPFERGSLQRFIDQFRPAHAAASIVYVEPRMRVGVQATIGFDAVIGRYPIATTTLGEMRLGRGSVTPVPPRDRPPRLGKESYLGAATVLPNKSASGRPS